MTHPGIPGLLPVFVDVGISPSKIPAQFIRGGIWTQKTLSDTPSQSWRTNTPGPQDPGKVHGEALPLLSAAQACNTGSKIKVSGVL